MGKTAAFLAGVISGAVALGVTACYIDQLDKSSSCEDEQVDEIEQADVSGFQPANAYGDTLSANKE